VGAILIMVKGGRCVAGKADGDFNDSSVTE
jgi:hypothetical protein